MSREQATSRAHEAAAAPRLPAKGTPMAERHRSIVDVHLILRRSGRIVMLRRAQSGYAAIWTECAET